MKRPPGPTVPQDGCLALVGDSDRGQVASLKTALRHRLGDDFLCASPDLIGIMLHPTRLWINLPMFFLGRGRYHSGSIQNQKARAGGALVDCSDVVRHGLKQIPGGGGEPQPGIQDLSK